MSTLRLVDSVSGSLSDNDCRLSDGSVFAAYALTLPAFGRLRLNAASSDFPATMFLRDASGRKIDEGAAIERTAEAGEYRLLVNASAPGQSGRFTLTAAFQAEPNTLCRDITRIGPTQAISGHLVDSSCRQPNGAPYDGYLVSILAAGTIDISLSSPNFSGVATLRGDDGRALVSDPVSLSFSVLGNTDYTIIAAGADPAARGDYTLTVKFTPEPNDTCHSPKTLTASADIKGSIAEGTCSFGTDLSFAYYDLSIFDAGFADLRVLPSGDASMLVALLDTNGRLLSQDLGSGGLGRPILRQQLPPGAYIVLLVADKRGGDYTLQYKFNAGPPATCPALDLRAGVQSGSLAGASSCHAVDALEDAYTFSTAVAGTVDITLSSGDFVGALVLRDAKDNNLARSDAGDFQDAHIKAELPAGSYALAANSANPGAYTVSYTFTAHDVAACSGPVKLGTNSAFFGTLGAGTCHGQDGQAMDTYEFTTLSAGVAGIFMTSNEVDSYLKLTDAQGSALRRDDNSYGGSDAMILQWLPAGTYRLNASAWGGSPGGRYRVDVLFAEGDRPAGCLPLGDLLPGSVQGTLYINSCQYTDNTFADVYRLVVTDPTQLNITMASSDFDAYLTLLDEKGNIIDLDDDSAGGNDAQLTTSVDAGTYYVVAKVFVDQGYVAGAYKLLIP